MTHSQDTYIVEVADEDVDSNIADVENSADNTIFQQTTQEILHDDDIPSTPRISTPNTHDNTKKPSRKQVV